MTRLVVIAALIVLAYWGFLFVVQRSILFPAPPAPIRAAPPPGASPVWLESAAGRTEAWLLPPLRTAQGPAPVIIFAHGNGELIDHWPGEFDPPRRWGVAVLLVEYPGYGRSAGHPAKTTIDAVMDAAWRAVTTDPALDPSRVVLYGRSLGGGAVAGLGRRRPAAALILESTFTSTAAFAARYLAPSFLVRDRFDNVRALEGLTTPILILHGDHDDVIPTAHGRKLAEVAGVELQLLPCGHNDCERPWPLVHGFLRRHNIVRDLP